MNKYIVCIISLACLASAAATKSSSFSLASFIEGSWVIARRTVNLDTGNIIGEVDYTQYNITKTAENEFDLFPLEKNNFYRSKEADQIVVTTTSTFGCEIQKYSADKDGFSRLMELKFIPMLPNESYFASGLNPLNAEEEYEVSTMSKNHAVVKITSRKNNIVTIYAATRVIIPPPATFFQKYGMSLLMAGMILLQMGAKTFFGNAPAAAGKAKTD